MMRFCEHERLFCIFSPAPGRDQPVAKYRLRWQTQLETKNCRGRGGDVGFEPGTVQYMHVGEKMLP